MKNYLYVFRRVPYGSSIGQEGLDALLIAPSFENINATVLFMDDGVYQIKSNQNNSHLKMRQYTKTFAALQDFGVEKIYVDNEALQKRGLSKQDLAINVELLDTEQMIDLFQKQHRVFGF